MLNVIELFGLPGVGKSTIAKKVYKSFSPQNSHIYTISDIKNISKLKLYYYFITILLSSMKSISLLFKCYFHSKVALKRFKILFKQIAYFHIISNQKNLYILDQGVLQALWALYAVDENFKIFSIDNIKLPKNINWNIVFLYSKIDHVVDRKINRKDISVTEFDNLNRNELRNEFQNNYKHFEYILSNEILKDHKVIKFHYLENQDNHKKLLEKLNL